MLHEKPVPIIQLADDGDGGNMAWTGEKRRRKNLRPSSSDATATADDHGDMEDTIQGCQDPISHATDMEGTIQGGQDPISHATDMEGTIQAGQDYDLLLKTEPAKEESEQCFGPYFLLSKEDQAKDCQFLLANIQKEDDYPTDLPLYLTREEHRKIEARLARYRVAHYKVVNLECARELKEPEEYTDDELLNESYFEGLEDDESFEWYIHPEDTYNIELNDYQRIVPRNFLPGRSGNLYRYHDEYRSRYHTYKIDDVYVKYYAEISKKIKEYTTELEMDASLKDIDLQYFEIWRLVAKENRTYKEAVKEVYESGVFPIHKAVLHAELNGGHIFVTMQEMIYAVVLEGGIELTDEEKKARGVFRELSFSMHKPLNMAQYAQKKVEIAKQLKLDNEDGFVPFRPFEF
ncbi:unnamed protein product [Triticum turgidum subsp. durum]|uniref:Uncharacterized protein n=1 Tax=Triticum turgidum subsp. durum TaxID=4567 RepID=A0A9R1QY65_TRITD|nr:unnamed protein product [Triticum turgidum subsp. durum]